MVEGAAAAYASGSPTHEIVLTVTQPAGVQPFRLRLLHPVQATGSSTWGMHVVGVWKGGETTGCVGVLGVRGYVGE